MSNGIVILALVALAIWNLIQRSQIKDLQRVSDRIKYNAVAFEIRSHCIEYFHEHGQWPESIEVLREHRHADSYEYTLWADWKIDPFYESVYLMQWLLEVYIPGANVRRIFHTGIRQAA